MLDVSTNGDCPDTCTVSSSVPIFNDTLIVRVSPTASTMPVCSKVLKPLNFAITLYGPTGRFVKTYSPREPVATERVIPVLVCVTLTSTPGRAAFDSSFTVPES